MNILPYLRVPKAQSFWRLFGNDEHLEKWPIYNKIYNSCTTIECSMFKNNRLDIANLPILEEKFNKIFSYYKEKINKIYDSINIYPHTTYTSDKELILRELSIPNEIYQNKSSRKHGSIHLSEYGLWDTYGMSESGLVASKTIYKKLKRAHDLILLYGSRIYKIWSIFRYVVDIKINKLHMECKIPYVYAGYKTNILHMTINNRMYLYTVPVSSYDVNSLGEWGLQFPEQVHTI